MAQCGTFSGYTRGCRCDDCRCASTEHKGLQRQAQYQRDNPDGEWHQCDECPRAFRRAAALATHVGRAHRGGKSKPDHIARLFLAGIALPLARAEGEQLPCDGLTDMFFPDPTKGRGEYRRKIEAAQSLCAGCGRREECLDGAMKRCEPAGVWGGVNMATLFAPHLRRPARAS